MDIKQELLAGAQKLYVDSSYRNAVFARGFFFSKSKPNFTPGHWNVSDVFGAKLYWDPHLQYVDIVKDSTRIVCLGKIIDIRHSNWNNYETVNHLVDELVCGEERFFEALDWTNGRYVIIFSSNGNGNIKVLTDATGMKSVFYSPEPSMTISSHAALVAINSKEQINKVELLSKFGFPGRYTPYSNIFILTPNTYLSLPEKSIHRFYPRSTLKKSQLQEAAVTSMERILASGEAFLQRYPILMSLTAGLDSRFILACLKPRIHDIRYFTYFKSDDNGIYTDVLIASNISKQLNLNFQVINLDKISLDEDFIKLSSINSHYKHLRKVSKWYYEQFYNSDVVHLRSNISEIGRAFYSKKLGDLRPLDAQVLLHLYSHPMIVNKFKEAPSLRSRYIEIFEDFIEATQFKKAAEYIDYRDLFYWEHRMGAWHSQVVAESDPGVDTVSLFNCRKILECLLAIDWYDRKSSKLYYYVIETNLPELQQYPINPKNIGSDDKRKVHDILKDMREF